MNAGPSELKEASSSDSSLSRCAPIRTGILNKLSFDRRYAEIPRIANVEA
jgi:hypothetical protein